MNNIILNIFRANKLNPQKIDVKEIADLSQDFSDVILEFYAPDKVSEMLQNDYYLVVYVADESSLKQILQNQQQIFEYLLKSFNSYDNLRKNITAIICLDTDMQFIREKTSPLHLALQEVEEDPYYFRKIVLTYNNNQLKAYSGEFADINNKLLQEYVSLPTNFDNYKKLLLESTGNELNSDLYCFVSNLFLAIPFLNIDAQTSHKSNIVNDFHDALGDADSDNIRLLDIIEKIDLTQINETLFDENSKYANELKELLK